MQRLLLGALILLSPLRAFSDTPAPVNPILESQDSTPKARFAIVPLVPEPSGSVDALYTALRSQGALVVGPEERVGIDRKGSDLLSVARTDDVKVLLLKSQEALRAFEMERARELSAKALSLLWRLERPTDHKDLIADTILLRANLLLSLKEEAQAQREMLLLSRLDKTRKSLHPGLYPPNMVAAYAAALLSTEGEANAFLTIQSDAESSTSLDGVRVVANTPFEVSPGPHLVHVSSPGRVSQSRWIDLKPTEARSVFCFCPPEQVVAKRKALLSKLSKERRAQDAKALAALMGADTLILTSPRENYVWSEGTSFLNLRGESSLEKAQAAMEALAQSRTQPNNDRVEQSNALLWVGGAAVTTLIVAGAATAIWYASGEVPAPTPQPFNVGL